DTRNAVRDFRRLVKTSYPDLLRSHFLGWNPSIVRRPHQRRPEGTDDSGADQIRIAQNKRLSFPVIDNSVCRVRTDATVSRGEQIRGFIMRQSLRVRHQITAEQRVSFA